MHTQKYKRMSIIAQSNGQKTNIVIDSNENGHTKHNEIQVNNDDLSTLLLSRPVSGTLKQRLLHDFLRKSKRKRKSVRKTVRKTVRRNKK